ncbi:NADPH:quinone reductase-like Zn-dependent oxidoreductase [Allocatelliglobosispora scoriae]|uniref:NADPH:quinone reductase-like Zn-dependent oxidoreductase n=1 Tax=Allocatelliglobosispora scoriae TaxID=643052 RepID=A0A841C3X7_9ACTN|nr:NAD(P)-dependent alcohol dehydrogenase [Allocatelliglobosispora scoriae]MBB5873531.1 NADPH:quinone reductase-like Zn-dependent oxidoreductase [Allocatelliglobosispora scoriae]
MRAIARHRWGSPELLALDEVDPPAIGDDEVLVSVRAASVNPYDWHRTTGTPYLVRIGSGLVTPRATALGADLAGVVAATGRDVTAFRVGDEVFGMGDGAFAEQVAIRPDRLAPKPADLSFEEAAAVPLAGLTALQGLRDRGGIRPGQRVLINGAAGGVGTFAVQLAKAFGAEVTGVCGTGNVELVRGLGADHVIDYTRADFTRDGRTYDLILDVAGNRSNAARRRALTPGGTLVLVGGPKRNRWTGPLGSLLRMLVAALFSSRTMVGMLAKHSHADLLMLRDLLDSGQVRPVVERTYPLAETANALRHVAGGHTRGKVVITMA